MDVAPDLLWGHIVWGGLDRWEIILALYKKPRIALSQVISWGSDSNRKVHGVAAGAVLPFGK